MELRLGLSALLIFSFVAIKSQDTIKSEIVNYNKIAGYHVGVVQILFSHNQGETTFLTEQVHILLGFHLASRSILQVK
ncbi:MAG: hypothetical protein IPN46_05345 [Saprospiraceae bacterium]|nr:hypothetical protein [Saprospiraceae bacterium]